MVGRFFLLLLIQLCLSQAVVDRETAERVVVENTRRHSERMRKRYWILSFLYNHRTETSSSLHAISRAVEERMDLTVRDQDIRDLIDELVSRRMIVRNMKADSNVDYQISDFGIEWWEKHGEAMLQIM